MGTDKPTLVIVIVLYLFLASLACAHTFGGDEWSPGFVTEDDIFEADFNSSTINVSDLNIEVHSGHWEIESGNLTSKDNINDFTVKKGLIETVFPVEVQYDVYNMNSLTRFYVLYKPGWNNYEAWYWEFDIAGDTIYFVNHDNNMWPFPDDIRYLKFVPFSFTKSDYVVISIVDGGGILKDPIVTLKIDGVVVEEGVVMEVLYEAGDISGVYCEQKDLKINYMSEMEEVGNDLSVFSGMSVLLKILLFMPPEDDTGRPVMPMWLNFALFKIPLIAVVLVGVLIIRGVE